MSVYFFGPTGRLRLDGRLTVDLSLLRVKPLDAMQKEWDSYDQAVFIPVSEMYCLMTRTGCTVVP